MESVCVLGMLSICSFEDVKRKQIRLWVVCAFGIMGMVLHLIYRQTGIVDILGGMGIGALLLLMGLISRQKIGYGDGFMFFVTGIYLGFWGNLSLLTAAMISVMMYALVLLASGRGSGRYEIAFSPFVLFGYVAMLMMGGRS